MGWLNRFRRIWLRGTDFSATRLIAFGFAVVIGIGMLLLKLPFSTQPGVHLGWFDALFTSTSAVCVTGLITVDTATTYSRFGQVVLLLLFEIGGLGFMTFAAVLMRMIGRSLSVRQRMLVQESMNESIYGGLGRLVAWVVICTITIQLSGAFLLSFRMIPTYGTREGIFYSLFHSVSAFCNAGFDLFGNFSSLTSFRDDMYVNFVLIYLIVAGGIGFAVISNLIGKLFKKERLRLHTKVVLISYGICFVLGFAINLISEWNNPATLGVLDVPHKFLAAFFQSVTLRTAGFNTIDQQALRPIAKLINCGLMIIGASSASTGGGVKVTTIAVIALMIRMVIRGERDINVFGRRIDVSIALRAVAVVTIAFLIVVVDVTAISMMEPSKDIMDVLYECSSAMGTVGISAVGTSNFCFASKLLIMLTMFYGRIGPLSVALVLSRNQDRFREMYQYPEERIMIG